MIKFLPYEDAESVGIKAYENDEVLGFCTFRLAGFNMDFEVISCDDDIITEGLARAAMNYGANKNAYIARIRRTHLCPAFERLGFKGEETLSVEIPEALTSGCSCPHSKAF